MGLQFRIWRGVNKRPSKGSSGSLFRLAVLSVGALTTALHVYANSFDNGFEGEPLGQDLGNWSIVSQDDSVEILSIDGPDQHEIYTEFDVTVTPYNGDYMLRLGAPKTRDQTQNRGFNTITQSFTANTANLSLALRLFSLDHRGDDFLRFSLTQDSDPGTPIASDIFVLLEGKIECDNPCDAAIDVGRRQDFIATEWQVITFSGLSDGEDYTLTIELEAGQNESLASWVFVDGVNQPPEPVINYNPKNAVEGDFVVFDCLDSVDPENSDLTCIWTAAFGDVSPEPIIGSTVVYWFPNDGSGKVTLEVTDGETSSTTSTDLNVGSLAPLSIGNQDPLVNALDVEVLPGGSVELLCRFVDPGALDSHEIAFSVATGEVEYVEENLPALSSGFARTTFQVPEGVLGGSTIEATCTVSETNGIGSGSDDFTISVLDPTELVTRALNNTDTTEFGPPILRADQSTLGAITNPGEIAVYELRLPEADGNLPAGTEVNVTAHFPVDFDIVLLSNNPEGSVEAAPFVSAPFVSAPFVSAPFVSAPFVSAPFVSAPFVSAPFVSAPFVSAPFVSAPFVSAPFVSAPFVSAPFVSAPLTYSLWNHPTFELEFKHFPLSQLAGAPDGSNISGVDVSFDDLGALGTGALADDPVFVKGLSAEFGSNSEQILIEVGPGETAIYLAVIPQAGSFSTAPFSLEVEAAVPPPTDVLLGAACVGEQLVDPTEIVPHATGLLRSGGSETLIITQRERMMATFGMSEADWNQWMLDMEPFFASVNATVVSVHHSIFNDADEKDADGNGGPCDVQAQNEVAQAVKDVIDTYRTAATKYVQLMGSLDIIPPYYVPDETQTGNEALFANDLLVQHGKPLQVAMSEGFMLTDAFYVDSQPQPFNGRFLYVEDISVSRLVETPEEILANADRFVDNGGVINLMAASTGTKSTGYDFFIDGTDVINGILAPLSNQTLNDDTWDAAELRCHFFGTGEGCPKSVSALNAINAHMSYNAGLTAKGFNCQYLPEIQPPGFCPGEGELDPLGEVFLSGESAGMYDSLPGLPFGINGIVFSIGCHSGLSVPDAWGLPEELGLPLDPAADWVQELGTWVGAYNFAYGDTDVADRGTEGIMPLVIANFTGGMTLGDALIQAKWQYGAGLFEFGVYDEKSLVGLNLFGMPQAVLDTTISPANTASAFAASSSEAFAGGQLTVNVTEATEDPAETQVTGTIIAESNEKGVWYSIDGQAQAIIGRPLLPSLKLFELRDVVADTAAQTLVHGVALRGGTYTVEVGQDPVFPAQTHDLVVEIGEPQPCVETLTPSLIATANTFTLPGEPGDRRLQSLVVQPGQFRCTDTPEQQQSDGYIVNGDFRIWQELNLELMHPTDPALDDDLKPPVVTQQDLLANPDTGILTASLAAVDTENETLPNKGMREIIALIYADDDDIPGGTGTATAYSGIPDVNGVVEFELPYDPNNLLSFQYIDWAGNITAKTLKGALLQAIEVAIRTSIINQSGNTQIVVLIEDFVNLVKPYMTIDFGDGDVLVIELDDENSEEFSLDINQIDGSATVTIPHDYSDSDQDSYTIRVEVRAAGALGTDEKIISTCSDPIDNEFEAAADIIGCNVTASGTQLTIDVVLRDTVATDIQYRLNLPVNNTQIKYADGAVNGPKKLKPSATAEGDTVSFTFDAARLPWDGISPLDFQLETQDGVSGGAGQGFVDRTDVKTYFP